MTFLAMIMYIVLTVVFTFGALFASSFVCAVLDGLGVPEKLLTVVQLIVGVVSHIVMCATILFIVVKFILE